MDVPMIVISGPEETGYGSIAHTAYVAKEYLTHTGDEKAGTSIQEAERVFNEPARRGSDSAGRESSKRRQSSCSITLDPGKRLKPAVFLQPRSVSFQHIERSKATRTASLDLVLRELNQYGLSISDKVSHSKTKYSKLGEQPPHHWLGLTRDIVSLAIKQHQLVCLETSTRMEKGRTYLAQSASYQHAAMGKGCRDLQGFATSSAARCASMNSTDAAGSGNPSRRNSTTAHARSTTSSGLATRSGHSMNAQTAGSEGGDGGDDPDDHNKQFKPLRGHELDTADGERKLMLDVCARSHQQSHLQHPEECESRMEDDQDRPRYGRGRSCSCSNNATPSFTVGLAQRSDSAPAQTQYPQPENRDGLNPENYSPPLGDDQDLRQALICRSDMVRASDITGEPTVDAPWTHHMRPSSLLALRRGAEGYGGYGGLASLPDVEASTKVENEHVTAETLREPRDYNAMNNQTATNRDSFSFIGSVSSVAQHVALAEEPVEEPGDGGLPHDQYSVISQHRALVEGPPEELIYTCALQDRGLIEALFVPSTIDTETFEHVEGSEPRRPSVPHMTPQAPSDSFSADDQSTRTKFQTGLVPHGIRERCKERRRQGSTWSTVFCCLGNTEHDRQSSPETEPFSSETARSKNSTSQNGDQDRRTSDSHAEGHQGFSLGQRRARTEVVQEACARVPDQTPAVTDTPATSARFAEPESAVHAIVAPTIIVARDLPRRTKDGATQHQDHK